MRGNSLLSGIILMLIIKANYKNLFENYFQMKSFNFIFNELFVKINTRLWKTSQNINAYVM